MPSLDGRYAKSITKIFSKQQGNHTRSNHHKHLTSMTASSKWCLCLNKIFVAPMTKLLVLTSVSMS